MLHASDRDLHCLSTGDKPCCACRDAHPGKPTKEGRGHSLCNKYHSATITLRLEVSGHAGHKISLEVEVPIRSHTPAVTHPCHHARLFCTHCYALATGVFAATTAFQLPLLVLLPPRPLLLVVCCYKLPGPGAAVSACCRCNSANTRARAPSTNAICCLMARRALDVSAILGSGKRTKGGSGLPLRVPFSLISSASCWDAAFSCSAASGVALGGREGKGRWQTGWSMRQIRKR